MKNFKRNRLERRRDGHKSRVKPILIAIFAIVPFVALSIALPIALSAKNNADDKVSKVQNAPVPQDDDNPILIFR